MHEKRGKVAMYWLDLEHSWDQREIATSLAESMLKKRF